ncbi:hypothetical protein DMENIID0001_000460 [Sergentomyia squamirostris]
MKIILCLVLFVVFPSASCHDTKIVGGEEATPHQFPHMISFQSMDVILFNHFCGGSLLNEMFVLTAAHCVKYFTKGTDVVAGAHNLRRPNKNEQRRKPKNVYIHEDYDTDGHTPPHDIALIEVDPPFKFNEYVQALNLPTEKKYPTGKATVSGWGSTSNTSIPNYPNKLRWAELPVLDEKKCHTGFPGSAVHETNICAGDSSKTVCFADSGGGLFQKDSQGKVVVYGVVSWGWEPCGQSGMPGVFVNVSHYLKWIQDHMKTVKRNISKTFNIQILYQSAEAKI